MLEKVGKNTKKRQIYWGGAKKMPRARARGIFSLQGKK
ncbi:MAG: hypothetical protein RL757_1489 [Bacteroidota bacterium]|jgi:hypothetical protein